MDIGGLRQQKLLVVLLLEPDRVVTADRLIEAVWDDRPPATVRRQLHNAVSGLRRSFGSAKSMILKDGPGYRLDVPPQDVDAHRFVSLVGQATAAAAEKQSAQAINLLEQGLTLWKGPALSGLNGSVLDIIAASLEEKRLGATEQLLELRLRSGEPGGVLVPQLGVLVSQNPLREETRRLLMLALLASGRKADALTAYEQGRRLLRAEMGVEPSLELRRLYEQILRDDPAALAGRRDAAASAPAARPRPVEVVHPPSKPLSGRSFLPYHTAHFIGRAEELRSLAVPCPAAETALRIVAVDGMAGAGKTTLALRLAHQLAPNYPGGQLFIDMQGHTPGQEPLEPEAALERLLLDFGLRPEEIPVDARQRSARWRAEVAERGVLVVLDDVLDVRQIRPLLPGTGKAQVIITSRRRLVGLDGATFCSLDMMPEADAVELFTRIAGAGRVGGQPKAVAEVVALCAKLPLAVSIAASRFHSRPAWTLTDLIARLRDDRTRLREFSLGERDLSALFAASYRHLSPEQRRLLCVLGLAHVPGEQFDAGAAAALANISVPEADRLLEELFDVHLLRQSAAGRYHFHELLRQYALTQVATELQLSDVRYG
ncbi:MAG TPA: BTAD domain-containing putative transcriptional regulator [Jatrophihabitans sp.]|uniref:AfsR/SARP family transcriptional regulator n=1 Tax=Jatrophihabitans sp. TaxID=1932789 RepID=UPI002F24AC88